MDSVTLTLWTGLFSYRMGVWLVLIILPYFKEIPVFVANSVDPDQMPHSAVSDLGMK